MYVCVCNAVTEHEIFKQAVESESLNHLIFATGASCFCGKCIEEVEKIYQRASPNNQKNPLPFKIIS